MANILPVEEQITAVGALAEGVSIRSIERITGIHRDTVMRLGVRVGDVPRQNQTFPDGRAPASAGAKCSPQ